MDCLLVKRQLFASRAQAQQAIQSRHVLVNGTYVVKSSMKVKETDTIQIVDRSNSYVGRGGWKLEAAIAAFGVNPARKIAADIGASTGGFTDCLLQHGAKKVYALDVGHQQAAMSLRQDPRVILMEGINARDLHSHSLPEQVDLCTVDVSFISLTLVLAPICSLLLPTGQLIALIKPQFEVGREHIGKSGIVRDQQLIIQKIAELLLFMGQLLFKPSRLSVSALPGQDGNREVFVLLEQGVTVDQRELLKGLKHELTLC